MELNTVIFDMDGLLIDSEPSWEEAGKLALETYDLNLTEHEYASTVGLRTKEWISWWFTKYGIHMDRADDAEKLIIENAIRIIGENAQPMPGVNYIIDFFKKKNFRIGLATSSPIALVEVVARKLNISHLLDAVSSAENLLHGKPHPEVYLDCAKALNVSPLQCICFEDSYNGMIAAKAARMKCVVIPAAFMFEDRRFGAADARLRSLEEFTEEVFESLTS